MAPRGCRATRRSTATPRRRATEGARRRSCHARSATRAAGAAGSPSAQEEPAEGRAQSCRTVAVGWQRWRSWQGCCQQRLTMGAPIYVSTTHLPYVSRRTGGSASDAESGQVYGRGLLVARGDPTPLLQSVEAPFDGVALALLAGLAVERRRLMDAPRGAGRRAPSAEAGGKGADLLPLLLGHPADGPWPVTPSRLPMPVEGITSVQHDEQPGIRSRSQR